jgi:signal transduction histidine kinase
MNCKSFTEVGEWAARMRDILNKYRDRNSPALILILGQEGWSAYISQPDDELDRSIPVICGMVSRNAIMLPDQSTNLREWEPESIDVLDDLNEDNIVSGFLFEYNMDRNIALIKQMYPRTENIAFVSDNSYGGVSIQAHIKKQMGNYPDLNLILLDGRKYTLASVVKQIENLPDNTVMMLGTWRVDMSDAYFMNSTLSDITGANPEVPCFSLTSIGINNGAVGGYVPEYRDEGTGSDLAQQAMEYADSPIPLADNRRMQYVPNHYVFDYRKVVELGFRESNLPSPHTLINREDSFVERYQKPLIIIGSLFVALLLGYLVVFYYFFRIKKLKDALEQSEADNILILNNLRADIKYITPDYRIKWFNNTIDGSIRRDDTADSSDRFCYERFFGLDHVCDYCPVEEAVTTGKSAESTIEMPGNKFITMLASPVFDEDKQLIGVVVRSEDVSKDKERERELRTAKEKAEESDRLKSAFLANMSHEIRTPLNAIVGFSSVLIAEGTDDNERQAYAQIIQTNSDLLLRLINDILDISRLETGKLTFNYATCEVVSLCNSVISTTRYSGKDSVEYILDAPFHSFEMLTDVQRLQQVLINLMSNAGKFTQKGSITLGMRLDEENDRMIFSVTDTGVGIPLEKQKLVFERFEKLDEYVQGTGLGLAICKITVNLLGGDIWVDGNYTGGARFVFTHPLQPSISATMLPEEGSEDPDGAMALA